MLAVAMVVLFGVASARRPLPGPRPHRDVATTQGVVRGYLHLQPPHYAYLGIPYARPPTGKYRFKAPVAPLPWDSIFEARHRVKCPQPGQRGDENCLVINVFTPQDASYQNVLVHVHDGNFKSGWGSFEPPTRLLQHGIVIVTFNYRLGALGFLSLGTSSVSGNAGLKDQVAALYWVHKNIAKFGGNPVAVTLYGTGSGAAAVEMLLQSGLATELIHKVILESGSILSPRSIGYYPFTQAKINARRLGYNGTDQIQSILDFYTKVSVEKLLDLDFLPIIENTISLNAFIDKDPRHALEGNHYQDVPLMMAYVKNEKRYYPINSRKIFPCNLKIDTQNTRDSVKDLIRDWYTSFSDVNNSKGYLDEFRNDVETVYPFIKAASLYTLKSTFPFFLMELNEITEDNLLVDDETNYITRVIAKYIFSNRRLQDKLEIRAKRLTQMWSNFIKYGDPTPLTTSLLPAMWQPANQERRLTSSVTKIPTMKLTEKMTMTEPYSLQLEFLDRIYWSFYQPNYGLAEGYC